MFCSFPLKIVFGSPSEQESCMTTSHSLIVKFVFPYYFYNSKFSQLVINFCFCFFCLGNNLCRSFGYHYLLVNLSLTWPMVKQVFSCTTFDPTFKMHFNLRQKTRLIFLFNKLLQFQVFLSEVNKELFVFVFKSDTKVMALLGLS